MKMEAESLFFELLFELSHHQSSLLWQKFSQNKKEFQVEANMRFVLFWSTLLSSSSSSFSSSSSCFVWFKIIQQNLVIDFVCGFFTFFHKIKAELKVKKSERSKFEAIINFEWLSKCFTEKWIYLGNKSHENRSHILSTLFSIKTEKKVCKKKTLLPKGNQLICFYLIWFFFQKQWVHDGFVYDAFQTNVRIQNDQILFVNKNKAVRLKGCWWLIWLSCYNQSGWMNRLEIDNVRLLRSLPFGLFFLLFWRKSK